MTIPELLHNIGQQLRILEKVNRPPAGHWAWSLVNDIKTSLGVEYPPDTPFYEHKELLWAELRKQAREQICQDIKIGEEIRFRNKNHVIRSFTPDYRVVLEHNGKQTTANPLTLVRHLHADYEYMTGQI